MFEARDSSGIIDNREGGWGRISGIALQLLTQYLSAGSRLESVLWQEDGRVTLVEKAYYFRAEKR